jgi:hypothetical protein
MLDFEGLGEKKRRSEIATIEMGAPAMRDFCSKASPDAPERRSHKSGIWTRAYPLRKYSYTPFQPEEARIIFTKVRGEKKKQSESNVPLLQKASALSELASAVRFSHCRSASDSPQ